MLIVSSKAFLSFCAKRTTLGLRQISDIKVGKNTIHYLVIFHHVVFSPLRLNPFSNNKNIKQLFSTQSQFCWIFSWFELPMFLRRGLLRMTIMLRDVFVSYICVYVLSYAYLCYIYVIYFSFSSSFSFDLVKIGTHFFAYILEDVLLFLVVYVNEECE